MSSVELAKMFAACADDTQFQNWFNARQPDFHLVYIYLYGTVWKYTLKEWWRLVTKTVRNDGCYDLPESAALRSRPKHILLDQNGDIYTRLPSMRCVSLRTWTLDDWKAELA